jgi:hypothetical protein
MIHEKSAGSTQDTTLHVEVGSPPESLDEADAFRLAHRQRAGVSPVIRLKTVEKCACVQKPTVSATSAKAVSEFDSSDFALDALMQQVLAQPVSRRGAELGREVHPGQSRHLGKFGQVDAVVEVRPDIFLDAPEPPFRQGIDLRVRARAGQDALPASGRCCARIPGRPNGRVR